MKGGRACPTPLSDATLSTIDGFLSGRPKRAAALGRSQSEQHTIATQALARLLGQGDEVYLTPQNLIEFWAVATRSVDANGFGWTSERTSEEVSELRERFPILPDSPEVFAVGLNLSSDFRYMGKRVHDAVW